MVGKKTPHLSIETILIFLVLAALGLASCAQTSPQPSPQATDSPARATVRATATDAPPPTATPEPVSQLGVDPSQLRGVTVDFWHGWSGPAAAEVGRLVEAFNSSNAWGIRVEQHAQGSLNSLSAQIPAALQDPDPPDLIAAYPYQIRQWDQSSALVDLEVYVDDPIWGISPAEQAQFYAPFWQQDVRNGKRLAAPVERYAHAIYYNRSWAKEMGFTEAPTSPASFREQACAAAESGPGGGEPNEAPTGYLISNDYPAVLGWIAAFGGEVVAADGSAYQLNSAPVEQAFTFLRELYDQGCAQPAEGRSSRADFAARRALFISASVLETANLGAAFAQAESNDEWMLLAFPGPSGQAAVIGYGPSLAISAPSPEEQLAAWLFLKWLIGPQAQAELIQVSGALPLDASTAEQLDGYRQSHPQWAAAVDQLSHVQAEPALPSWYTVRWALSDAATQLFRWYFTPDGIPELMEMLDETAAELQQAGE